MFAVYVGCVLRVWIVCVRVSLSACLFGSLCVCGFLCLRICLRDALCVLLMLFLVVGQGC